MSTLSFDDTIIACEEHGEGFPALMLHGWGIDHRLMTGCMEPVFARVPGFRRIYPDLPGMGASTAGRDIRTSDDMLRVLTVFVDAFVPANGRFLLVGESYGGYLVRGMCSLMPEHIAGVVLICPCMKPGWRAGRVEPLRVMERDEEFLAPLTGEQRQSFESMNVVLNEAVWRRYEADIHPVENAHNREFLDHVLDGACSFDVDAPSAPFEPPCLIFAGRQDAEVGYLDQLELLKRWPNATCAVLNRAGHNLQLEQPEMFTALTAEWLRDNAAAWAKQHLS